MNEIKRYTIVRIKKLWEVSDSVLNVLLARSYTHEGAIHIANYFESDRDPCKCNIKKKKPCKPCLSRYPSSREYSAMRDVKPSTKQKPWVAK